MKIKFKDPEKLFRCHNCFRLKKYIVFNPTKTEEETLKSCDEDNSNAVIIYTENEIETIDFNKYYDVIESYEEILEIEKSMNLFGVKFPGDELATGFIALENRLYYELYNDDLTIIK